LGELPLLAGEIEATSPSARELAAWLGFGDSVPTTLGAVSFKGRTDAATGAAAGTGSLLLRDTPLTYDLKLADVRQALGGKPTPLAGNITAADLSATIDGTVTLASAAGYEGQLSARADKIGDVARRLGISSPALAALGPGAISGKAKLSAERASLEGAEFDADGRTGTFTGDIALSAPRPRISGDLTISRIDLDALLGRAPRPPMPLAPEAEPSDEGFESAWDVLDAELDAIENPPQPTFGLQAAPAAASGWSTTPIDLTALRAVDLDLELTAKSVKFGTLPLQDARVATKLDNGELAANIEEITIGAGKGTGAIDLKARGTEHDAAIALKLTGVEAEPITYELSGKPLLKGTSNVDITTRARGKSLDRLVATLDGNARFDMAKGRLRGWDIGKMVEELWNYKGWGYNPARNTPVDKLTATYTIKAGTVRSAPDLTLSGPTAGLRSVGDVVVPQRLIDQNVKVQNLFFNIVVKGDWTKKLWIGPAFLAGLSPTAPGAQPEAVPTTQLPRAMPANIKVRIEAILNNPETAARLSPEQKAVLQSLLAAGASGM
jgi:AsmA protein